MAAHAPSHDRIARMADDVHQLTHPFIVPVRFRIGPARRTRWRAIRHESLLDQLRAAALPGGGQRGPERRRTPDSRPPAGDALHTLLTIEAGARQWCERIGVDDRGLVLVLRTFVGVAAEDVLAPSIADDLSDAVHGWWRCAAVQAGWRPRDLEDAR